MMREREGAEIGDTHSRMIPVDALVIFGVTGDLVQKMIFSALYANDLRTFKVLKEVLDSAWSPSWPIKPTGKLYRLIAQSFSGLSLVKPVDYPQHSLKRTVSWTFSFPPASFTFAALNTDIFRLALNIAQALAQQVVYIENTPFLVQIAKDL